MLKTGAPKMLIYTLTKNAACKVYELLSKSVHNKQCVGMYHASLSPATKAYMHTEFLSIFHFFGKGGPGNKATLYQI